MLARSAALQGFAPQVAINREPYGVKGYSGGWTLYRLSGALVELGSQANVCSCRYTNISSILFSAWMVKMVVKTMPAIMMITIIK